MVVDPHRPRYPIFVPSRGRFDYARRRTSTIGNLMADKVPFRVVVVPSEVDAYERVVGADRLLVLPDDDHVLLDARNFIRDVAEREGHARHFQLDDNIKEFRRLYRGRRIPVHCGLALRVCEDMTDRYENVAISGLNYQMFVPDHEPVPFRRNVHVYSCVAPQTPVLCADLVWRPAGSLEVGQAIVAFDEEPVAGEGRTARRYRTATVERNDVAVKPCRRIETDRGDPVVASEEHPWLAERDGRLVWVETRDLVVGDRLAHLARPWRVDGSHDGGWISGMFDGEGSMIVRSRGTSHPVSVGIGISQLEGPVLDRVRRLLFERGYNVATHDTDGRGTYLRGGFPACLRFAGEFRPTRVVDRLPSMWEGRKLWAGTTTYELATITSISDPSPYPVASISTSTRTFITGGYLTHNCTLVSHAMPYRWRLVYNDDTDLCLQALVGGWATLLLNAFMANKERTMVVGGGNTSQLYASAEEGGSRSTRGRFEMAEVLRRAWPGLVEVRWRFQRHQHVIDWKQFDTPLRLRPGVDLAALPLVDEYGMTLRAVREVRSPTLRALLDTYHQQEVHA